MTEGTAWLYELSLELLALFGFLCILLNILLPLLAFVLRFVLVEVPHEWREWQLHRSQQRELRRLQRGVDALTRRKLAEEQETRRRTRTGSAIKRQQRQAAEGNLPSGAAREDEAISNHRTPPRQQRHRLSIHSTAKKSATSTVRQRKRDQEDLA